MESRTEWDTPTPLSEIEKVLSNAVRVKTKDSPCPRCENPTFFVLGPTTGSWFVVCCQRCGFKLEYLSDVLLKNLEKEGYSVE